jgi:hypothetical protein
VPLDYIHPLYRIGKLKIQNSKKIKDYADFILLYMIREQIYLELAIFSITISVFPFILHLFQLQKFLLTNAGLIITSWNLLIIQMCSLIAVGFSELINLHHYFFSKNKTNIFFFPLLYLLISFIISIFFITSSGLILTSFNISVIDIPFTFIEVFIILLLGMYVSLFFPARRRQTPALVYGTITILWLFLKQFIITKINDDIFVVSLTFVLLILMFYGAIIVEFSKTKKGKVIKIDK